MALDPASLAVQVGASALVGALIGFAAKRVAKVLAVVVGAELMLFKFLESQGVLVVNWERLGGAFAGLAGGASGQAESLLVTFVSTAAIGAGFAGGFLLGFTRA